MHRLIFVLISVFATNGFAADVANLYQSRISVATQNEVERSEVAPDVLRQVILKVVGDSDAVEAAYLSPILSRVDQFIQQYQYRRVNKISDDLTQPDRLELLLTFNETRLNQALIKLGLPIWGKSRPEVLLWLAIDDGNKREILGSGDTDMKIPAAIKQAADKRGLSILMPVMDLQDQQQVTFADLWGGFPQSVKDASRRYGAQVVLMASVSVADNGALQARWQSLIDGQSEKWQSRGSFDNTVDTGIDELSNGLARRYSQVVTVAMTTKKYGQEYLLQVNNVRDYADYSRVMAYLGKLQLVSGVQLSSLVEDQLDVTVSLKGYDLDVLNRTLAIDRVLIEDSPYSNTAVMRYRLSP